jgi:undecaprenyl diphosphate synthase
MENLPNHIAIVMDGNRRWAKAHNVPAKFGHKEGAKTIEKIVRYANKLGIKHMTVYAFSTENWKRSEEEVSALITLLKMYLDDFSKKAEKDNIRIRVLGDISVLDEGIKKSINEAVETTKDNTGISFNIAFNYGGRDEIVKATKKIASKVKAGEIEIEDINEDLLSKNMYTYDIPDPDLMIRTSGELRLSGFLIWQLAYTEFLFVDKYWPDFNEQDLDEAIEVYKKRVRKFGAN